jgi:general L-amino acid transport system substrate-binding protein
MSRSVLARCLLVGALWMSSFVMAPACAATLENVRARGMVLCGVSQGVPGLSVPDSQGRWQGLDADFCRGVASAVLGDASKVEFRALTSVTRFTALQSGEVDLLARTVTWTMQRDTATGLNFRAINFYDGQGFMVRRSANVAGAKELDGASICVPAGTTTELNLADYVRTVGIRINPVTFSNFEEAASAYESGRCDSLTADRSQLAARSTTFLHPGDHIILQETISKEPLGPVVRQGDEAWFDIVTWVHFAMVTAEELGVTSANAEASLASTNPDVRRLLGSEGRFGEMLGLSNDWAYRIVRQVGNYGEAYDRNLGASSAIKIERGLNNLWNRGGLQFAPPIR